MSDGNRDVTRFTQYFTFISPNSFVQTVFLFLLGLIAGTGATLIVHYKTGVSLSFIISGASAGVIMISIPALLTAIFIKGLKRNIKLKHALFAVLATAFVYSIFLVIDGAIFAVFNNYAIVYVAIVLINASIYGYWFIINRVVMNQRKSRIVTAAIQPILNTLFYFPVSSYLLSLSFPVIPVLIKLSAGMAIFMMIGYAILYIMDRPAKRELKLSGIDIITAMVNQWLYAIIKDTDIFGSAGVKRYVNVNVLALKGRRKFKAIFVKPDLHYGPFSDIGGSITTGYMGKNISKTFNAAPFIIHGAVSMEDNPISTTQIHSLSNKIMEELKSLNGRSFQKATGYIKIGYDKPCKAINIKIGDSSLLTLTKAPTVTEDINREVGLHLEEVAVASGSIKDVILIDAHNSRFESANPNELRGIYDGSAYVRNYENAVKQAFSHAVEQSPIKFGSSSELINSQINQKDLGNGYTSVGVFGFKGKRFCIVYFDANNMLPSFRARLLKHIKNKFGMEAELYTTDTHSVNSISNSASNVLGRHTRPQDVVPVLDRLISNAVNNIEDVKYTHLNIKVKGFRVWGKGSEDTLMNVSREVIRLGKRRVPFIIVAGFIIAAWVIYII